jgi:hypothetical protein
MTYKQLEILSELPNRTLPEDKTEQEMIEILMQELGIKTSEELQGLMVQFMDKDTRDKIIEKEVEEARAVVEEKFESLNKIQNVMLSDVLGSRIYQFSKRYNTPKMQKILGIITAVIVNKEYVF